MAKARTADMRHRLMLDGKPVARLTAALFVAILLASCRSGPADKTMSEEQELSRKISAMTQKEQILAAELTLARSQAPYLVIDAANRKVDLKIQGYTLRSFAIDKIKRNGGSPFVVQTWIETDAKPLEVANRSQVIPGSGESTTASVATKDPWGPKRMPADYDLICKGSQALQIRSLASEQSRSRFTRWFVSNYRLTRDWLRNVWKRNKSGYKESFEIWLGEDNAKLLFWSLPRQFSVLLLNSQ
jgi:hypothetical protein